MRKLIKFISIFSFTILTPFLALAQTGEVARENAPDGFGGILVKFSDILSTLLPVLVSLGVIYFIWGMVQYFIADSEEAKKTGKQRIIYGIIGLAVIVSIWGLVNIVVETFNLGGQNAPSVVNLTPSQVVTNQSSCNLVGNPKFQDYLNYFTTCLINNSIIPFIFALAIVMFVWGVIKFFIINADEEAKRAQGKQFMIWGIIALTVMVSIWGLVGILGSTFGIDTKFLPSVAPNK
ncbi:MAG: hypothetical protein WC884_00455 [Candidatus Paceibacterota bacterium]